MEHRVQLAWLIVEIHGGASVEVAVPLRKIIATRKRPVPGAGAVSTAAWGRRRGSSGTEAVDGINPDIALSSKEFHKARGRRGRGFFCGVKKSIGLRQVGRCMPAGGSNPLQKSKYLPKASSAVGKESQKKEVHHQR